MRLRAGLRSLQLALSPPRYCMRCPAVPCLLPGTELQASGPDSNQGLLLRMAMKALRLRSSALRGGLPLLLRSHHECFMDGRFSNCGFLHHVHACCAHWAGWHLWQHGE